MRHDLKKHSSISVSLLSLLPRSLDSPTISIATAAFNLSLAKLYLVRKVSCDQGLTGDSFGVFFLMGKYSHSFLNS